MELSAAAHPLDRKGKFAPKLTERDREMIRASREVPSRELAARFGVTVRTIDLTRAGKIGLAMARPKLRKASILEVSVDFLQRAVPLMASTLQAVDEIARKGVNKTEPTIPAIPVPRKVHHEIVPALSSVRAGSVPSPSAVAAARPPQPGNGFLYERRPRG